MSQDLARAGYARSTQHQYLKAATELETAFDKPVAQITRDELRDHVQKLAVRFQSTATLSNRLMALMFLYRRTLGRPEYVSFIKLPKRRSRLPTVLSVEEVNALFQAIRVRRYLGLAMVMYGAGLRVSEATGLEVQDIDGWRNVIRVRNGKGGKAREVKLSPTLYQWLREYWANERPPLPYLFANKAGQLPQRHTLCKALAKAAKQAWISRRVTPHVLRHSFATHLLENGTDIHIVGVLLGHASIRSTVRYARVTQKLIQQTPSPLDLLPTRRR